MSLLFLVTFTIGIVLATSETDLNTVPQIPAGAKIAPTYPDVIPSINKAFNFESFAHVQQNGKTTSMRNDTTTDISFNTQGSDAVAVEYRQIRDKLQDAIANDSVLKQLSSPDDQVQYEYRLANLVADATKDTMFDAKNYRQDMGGGATRDLNSLKPNGEYDCEHLSYVRGMLMHEGDQHATQLGLRTQPTQFYLMSGSMMSNSVADGVLGGHQFIASAATGNIIEVTAEDHGYRPTDRTFDQLAAGYPAATENSVYTPSLFFVDEPTIRERHAAILKNPQEIATLEKLQGNRENDKAKRTPEIMAAVEREIAEKMPEIDAKCSKPINIVSEYTATITTEAGPLTTEPHVERACQAGHIVMAGDTKIASELAKQLAKKAVAESLGEKRFEMFLVPETQKSENKAAPIFSQPDVQEQQTQR